MLRAALAALLLLAVAWGMTARAVAAPECQTFTDHDEAELAVYRFESPQSPLDDLPPDREYELGTLTVVRQNVFEREENRLHRVANRYHLRTRESVIRSVLPVAEGEPVNGRRLREAERILRGKPYLYDVRIIPRRDCDGRLDVYVVTRDVWTLEPRLYLNRAGGDNAFGVGLTDINLLGHGKTLTLSYERDADRSGVLLGYGDPNVAGSRWAVDAVLIDNDDGERVALGVRRPFYELDARWGVFFDLDHFDRDQGLYELGRKIWEISAESRTHRLSGGWSPGLRNDLVDRWLLGFGYEDHRFELPPALLAAFPETHLADRRFAYPFVAFQRIEDDFDTRMNLDRVQRTEDVALGMRLYAELGYSSSATGGRGRYLVGRAQWSDAAWLTSRQLVAVSASMSGYYDLSDNVSQNLIANAEAAYRWRHAAAWSLLLRGNVTATRNLTLDRQLLAGGDTGLRGFPSRYQSGDRRFLITVEERYYSNIYPWRLFRLGGAVFFDVGRAWYVDDPPAWLRRDRDEGYHRVLSNVGFGLRLESTRTRVDRILHLDFGFPLRSGPDIRGMEVTLSAKQTL
jgi:hypothetical protein